MKKIIKYLFLALFAGFTMVSCDFLDVVPVLNIYIIYF